MVRLQRSAEVVRAVDSDPINSAMFSRDMADSANCLRAEGRTKDSVSVRLQMFCGVCANLAGDAVNQCR